jgi:hypothetical protein
MRRSLFFSRKCTEQWLGQINRLRAQQRQRTCCAKQGCNPVFYPQRCKVFAKPAETPVGIHATSIAQIPITPF